MPSLLIAILIFITSYNRLLGDPQMFEDYALKIGQNYQVKLDNFLPPNRLTVREIVSDRSKYGHYEEFLNYLVERKPQLFENYVLIHDTGSLQYADLMRPRVILFGDGLFLAFAENPYQERRTVEIIQFEEEERTFSFHELVFEDSEVVFHQQAETCQTCHGNPQRPLWEPYDFWPTIYGSSISRFGSDQELKSFQQLSEEPTRPGILRHLKLPNPKTNPRFRLHQVETFTQYVTQLQFIALMSRLKVHKEKLDPLIYSVLGILKGCTLNDNPKEMLLKLKSYFPPQFHAWLHSNLSEKLQETIKERNLLKNYLINRYQSNFHEHQTIFPMNHDRLGDESLVIAPLRIVLEYAGIYLSELMLSQGQNPFFMGTPGNWQLDLLTSFVLYDRHLFDDLKPGIPSTPMYGFSWAEFNCDVLAVKSYQAMQDLEYRPSASVKAKIPTVFGQCIHCHVKDRQTTLAPYIPFDRSKALHHWLNDSQKSRLQSMIDRIESSAADKMPPNEELSEMERQNLIKVLIEISRMQ